MVNVAILKNAGIDYDAGLKRFLNDSILYERVLTAYAYDDIVQRAQSAFDANDKTKLLTAVHEAKDSSGNTGLNSVYEKACTVVSTLRSKEYTEEQLAAEFHSFTKAYLFSQEAIQLALKSGEV